MQAAKNPMSDRNSVTRLCTCECLMVSGMQEEAQQKAEEVDGPEGGLTGQRRHGDTTDVSYLMTQVSHGRMRVRHSYVATPGIPTPEAW